MSVRRVMGTEVEYGISVLGQPLANPMVASSQVVNAYASATLRAASSASPSRSNGRAASQQEGPSQHPATSGAAEGPVFSDTNRHHQGLTP